MDCFGYYLLFLMIIKTEKIKVKTLVNDNRKIFFLDNYYFKISSK